MICKLISKICEKHEKLKIEKSVVSVESAPLPKTIDLPMVFRTALGEVGTKEFPGENHNPRIIEYHKSCELRAKTDEISWCSAFVNWCFSQGNDESRTKSAAAISWAKWGVACESPKIGDVVVFRRVDSSWRGHVGFYVAQDKKRVLVLGGNQGNRVSLQWYPKKGKSIYLFQFRSNN